MRRPKILWWGDGGATTGFGRVTHELCQRLGDEFEIHVLALNWLGEAEPPYDTAKYKLHLPTKWNNQDIYGFERLPELVSVLEPDIIFFFNDLPVLARGFENLEKLREQGHYVAPIVVYTPVDCEDLPPSWGVIASKADVLFTYTNFGKNQLIPALQRVIGDCVVTPRVVYHGIDHGKLRPVSNETPALITMFDGNKVEAFSKDEIKQAFGLDGAYILLFADRNSIRKYTSGFFEAVAPFMHRHPDAVIWMHCAETDQGGDIKVFTDKYFLRDRVFRTEPYNTFHGVSEDQLNTIYNIADVKVSTSMGEGCGLTNMEAVKAGVPTIVQDFSANFEMLGPGALYVQPAYKYVTPLGAKMGYPNLKEYDPLLERLYNDKGHREHIVNEGIKYQQKFSWDKSAEIFREEFRKLIAISDGVFV